MNLLDVVIVALLVMAAVGGYRLGFLIRVTSWIGLAGGVVVGALLLPRVARQFDSGNGRNTALLVAAGVMLGCALAGQALGLFIGTKLHLALPPGPVQKVDAGVGSVAGLLGVLVAVWLIVPAMADVPDWPARQARTSSLARAIDDLFPTPPDTSRVLRGLVGERYPQVFGTLRPAPELGPPPAASGLDATISSRVAMSTVKVVGDACDRIQEGSGFVVGPGLIVTNAHVVAGERRTRLERSDGTEVGATVVAFDPKRDLALLRARTIDRPPLPVADTDRGGRGAVFGHPGGATLRLAPFRVADKVPANGTDIYDRSQVQREVLLLSATLRPGDSGSALIDPGGRVVGVAFAIAPDRPGVAYALSTGELRAVLAVPRTAAVSTGACAD